jgi:hypothetical protein
MIQLEDLKAGTIYWNVERDDTFGPCRPRQIVLKETFSGYGCPDHELARFRKADLDTGEPQEYGHDITVDIPSDSVFRTEAEAWIAYEQKSVEFYRRKMKEAQKAFDEIEFARDKIREFNAR